MAALFAMEDCHGRRRLYLKFKQLSWFSYFCLLFWFIQL